MPGVKTKHENIDIVVVRENTEAEYSGLEQEVCLVLQLAKENNLLLY